MLTGFLIFCRRCLGLRRRKKPVVAAYRCSGSGYESSYQTKVIPVSGVTLPVCKSRPRVISLASGRVSVTRSPTPLKAKKAAIYRGRIRRHSYIITRKRSPVLSLRKTPSDSQLSLTASQFYNTSK